MSEKPVHKLDPSLTLCQVLNDLIFVILACNDRKHPDPRVWQALGRLDSTRRQLERDLGQEPTQMVDVYGRASYDK